MHSLSLSCTLSLSLSCSLSLSRSQSLSLFDLFFLWHFLIIHVFFFQLQPAKEAEVQTAEQTLEEVEQKSEAELSFALDW